MNPLLDQIRDEARSSWRFRWIALATATAVAIAGWLIAFALPNRYEAAASVFVNTRTPPGQVSPGPTLGQDADAELNFVRQSLLAGPTLWRIAREAGALPPGPVDPQTQEGILAGLRGRIEIEVKSASGREEEGNTAGTIYRIVFRDANRTRALHLVAALMDTLVRETLRGKRAGSANIQQELEAQIADAESRLHGVEDRLTAFKSRHPTPPHPTDYLVQLQRENDKVAELRVKLDEANRRRANLADEQPHRDPAIAAAQAHLDELLRRFTDKHPDVTAAREELEDLRKRRTAEIDAERRQADVEIAHLNGEIAEHQHNIAELTQLLATAPQVETELKRLDREYEANKAEYLRLLEELQWARRSDRADTVLFQVIEPPAASLRPVWPQRPLLLAESLLAALAAGLALAYGLHYLRPVVTTTSALAQAAATPVLGVVSVAFPDRVRRATRGDVLRFSLAGGCLVIAFIAVLILSLQGYHLSITALKQMLHS